MWKIILHRFLSVLLNALFQAIPYLFLEQNGIKVRKMVCALTVTSSIPEVYIKRLHLQGLAALFSLPQAIVIVLNALTITLQGKHTQDLKCQLVLS